MRTDQNTKNRYLITEDVPTQFSVTFPVYENTDIAVYLSRDNGATERKLTLNSEYRVTINANRSGATVTVSNGVLREGDIIAMVSDLPYTQELDLSGVSTISTDATEKQLDRTTQQIQQLAGMMKRAVLVSATSASESITANDVLAATDRAEAASVSAQTALAAAVTLRDQAAAAVASEGADQIDAIRSAGTSAGNDIEEEAADAISRVKGAGETALMSKGLACVERTWTITSHVAADANITIPGGAEYIVGKCHILVSYDGVVLSPEFFSEVGAENELSSTIRVHFDIVPGTELHVWISPLLGGVVESLTQQVEALRAEVAALRQAING